MNTLDVLAMESVNDNDTVHLPSLEMATVEADCNVNTKESEKEHQKKSDSVEVKGKEISSPVSPSITPVSPTSVLQDVSHDYQDIDPVSSKSASLSELEEGQIIESSSDASDMTKEVCKSTYKRAGSALSDGSEPKKPKKRISFSAVTAYYFPRAQGFTCIPSQGGSTLGMALKHSHEESFTLAEHANQQRRNHRRLLLQLRKRRKSRSASKAIEEDSVAAAAATAIEFGTSGSDVASNSNKEIKERNEAKESDSDESDADDGQISDISDSELDVDNYYFLQPVPTRQRRALLRESGVGKIETSEKDDCRLIRVSRESCGCSCQVYCEPETCFCAQSGIQCQVDRLNFPCGCSRDACANPSGRVEFNPVRVRTHFIHTLMRMELENAQESNKNMHAIHPQQQLHSQQPLKSMEELAATEVDGDVNTALVPMESQYNWENVMQMTSSQEQHQQALQHHTSYAVGDSLSENGWFCHYSNEASNNYSLYSGANSGASTELFPYEQNSYEPIVYHSTDSAAENAPQQHYTELGEGSASSSYSEGGVGSGTSDFYTEYSQNYQAFDPQAFNYHHAPNDTYSTTEEIFNYTDDGSGFNGLNGSTACSSVANANSVLDNVNDAPKTESSNSSSEEDVLDLGSSLATIVKETMVSV